MQDQEEHKIAATLAEDRWGAKYLTAGPRLST
jgi:hypothetical protein